MAGIEHRNNHRSKCGKTLVRMIVEAVYCLGFSILGLTGIILAFLAVNAEKNLLTAEQYQKIIDVIVISYVVIVIGLTIAIPFFVTRKIKSKGQAIVVAAERIKSQDLDFEIHPSGIKEIDQVLSSIDEMRVALKKSLETQWRMEQNRKDQISALAHDFKTPITILKGNLDLLQVTGQEEYNKDGLYEEYLKDARSSLIQMECYFEQLQEMTRAERSYSVRLEKEELGQLIKEALAPLVRIAEQKEITILMEKSYLVAQSEKKIFVFADKILMERAIHNLITNSFDFTPPCGVIRVILGKEDDHAFITITDTGTGFGRNALKRGTEQFFMDDNSRGRKNHYGLGLYIVDSIVKQHAGSMELLNDEVTGGAKIVIRIPMIKE